MRFRFGFCDEATKFVHERDGEGRHLIDALRRAKKALEAELAGDGLPHRVICYRSARLDAPSGDPCAPARRAPEPPPRDPDGIDRTRPIGATP